MFLKIGVSLPFNKGVSTPIKFTNNQIKLILPRQKSKNCSLITGPWTPHNQWLCCPRQISRETKIN